jgi:xylan 1,4-beta-xylosidase
MKTPLQLCILSALTALSLAAAESSYKNPVLPGDYPDPSVIRVDKHFYASATTSEWAPLFPILHSTNLVNWETLGAVFQKRPEWASGNFWAPELATYRGRYFVYYVGRKKGGSLSVAVATADRPEGPYTDHGPFISQEAGSIDPVPVSDENEVRYLIWKEDGNSRKKPTVLWAQRLSEDGTKLEGEMKELFRNDAAWEGHVIEGPFVVRRSGWFYVFYSGNACCGRGCHYGFGVARAKALLGPWEKNPANPILAQNEAWRCPGHGSIVDDGAGRDYLLYHAYDARDFIYVGRQGLLDEVEWQANGWPTINGGRGPSSKAKLPMRGVGPQGPSAFADDFTGTALRPDWQWPQNMNPAATVRDGKLWLTAPEGGTNDPVGAVVAVLTRSGDYTATAKVDLRQVKAGAMAGLAAFGDRDNALGAYIQDGKLTIWKRQQKKHEILAETPVPHQTSLVLRMTANNGHRFLFSSSGDGEHWQETGTAFDLEGEYLPPWDRGIRVALTAGGSGGGAVFDSLRVQER